MTDFVNFLSDFIGTYTPVTYDVISYSPDGSEVVSTVVASGLAGVDWLFLFRGFLLLILVYSFFKALGGVLCRIF